MIDRIIAKGHSIKLAILGAPWPDFDGRGRHIDFSGRPLSPIRGADVAASSLDAFAGGLEALVAGLQSRGIQVVLVMQKPELLYDVRLCLSRPFKSAVRDCRVGRSTALRHQRVLRTRFRQIAARHPGLVLFDPYESFCERNECTFLSEGRPLLRDIGHLSPVGSKIVARDLVAMLDCELP